MISKFYHYQKEIQNISKRGPNENDYSFLFTFFTEIANNRNELQQDNIMEMRSWFLGAMDDERTLQGHVCSKPKGYDGDFCIIDKIYTKHIASDGVLGKWDTFFHKGDASQAVRNRKEYFKKTLSCLPSGSRILNLASGSCRDLFEFDAENTKDLTIDCIDLDSEAIEFSKKILANSNNLSVNFINTNVFRFIPTQKYNLIWSAGLFDYFEDKYFTALVERFSNFTELGGSMIIGNFNISNSSKAYMEFGNWFLFHRSETDLKNLVSNVNYKNLIVDSEPLNVNLFLKLSF